MKNIKLFLFSFFALFISMASLMAQEGGDKVLYEAEWLGLAVTIVGAIGVAAIPLIRKMLSKWIEKEAVESIMVGVNHMWDNGVKAAKAAADDGKLTKDEAQRYRQGALDIALKTARGPVKKYLMKRGPEWGALAIKKIIVALKRNS